MRRRLRRPRAAAALIAGVETRRSHPLSNFEEAVGGLRDAAEVCGERAADGDLAVGGELGEGR